ncbi:uncharacterized protein BDW70DRAFT_136832 [Aspergillus foveolatus]|uniref:uncharacterized protein n=1 Tax=Aspergillus foveolatus TaxID=210207 RepID=UPI003CCD2C48
MNPHLVLGRRRARRNVLANKVIDSTEGSHSSCPQSNKLPRQLSLRVLLVGAQSEARTNYNQKSGVSNEHRIASVLSSALGFSFRLVLSLLLPLAGLFRLLFLALYPLSLGSGLYFPLQEVGVNRLHMWAVDIDQGRCAVTFVSINVVDVRSATIIETEQCLDLRLR